MNKNIHKIVLLLVSTIGFSCSNNSIEISERGEDEKQKIYGMIAGINGKEWKLQEFHISGLDLVSDQDCYSDDTFLFKKRSVRDSLNAHFRFDYILTHKKNDIKCGLTDDDYIEEVSISSDLKKIILSSQEWAIDTLTDHSFVLSSFGDRKIKLTYPIL